jgi:hypothetical protein
MPHTHTLNKNQRAAVERAALPIQVGQAALQALLLYFVAEAGLPEDLPGGYTLTPDRSAIVPVEQPSEFHLGDNLAELRKAA